MTGRILKDTDARAVETPRDRSMARGFESKDVEFQQAEAERREPARGPVSAEEGTREAARRTVELALFQARAELARTRSSVRRDALSRAVVDLETQLGVTPDSRR